MFVLREITKTLLFMFVWLLPILCAKLFGSQGYLFLFILSLFLTYTLVTHYEALEAIAASSPTPDIKLIPNEDYNEQE